MLSKADLHIKDACILIDLIELDLLDSFYKLNLTIVTTAQVVAEITDVKQKEVLESLITENKIQVDSKGPFEAINDLLSACAGLSFADCSVIELALRNKGTILSSDNGLRKHALKRHIAVKGILWIIEQLVIAKISTTAVAVTILEKYQEVNDWAPKKEIDTLIKKLSQGEKAEGTAVTVQK